MKATVNMEATPREGGKTQILLQCVVGASYGRGGKVHSEVLELSDSPDTQLLLKHFRRIAELSA